MRRLLDRLFRRLLRDRNCGTCEHSTALRGRTGLAAPPFGPLVADCTLLIMLVDTEMSCPHGHWTRKEDT